MSASPASIIANQPRPTVSCHTCSKPVFDGLVVKSAIIRVLPDATTEAKCKVCKSWVSVPLIYSPL